MPLMLTAFINVDAGTFACGNHTSPVANAQHCMPLMFTAFINVDAGTFDSSFHTSNSGSACRAGSRVKALTLQFASICHFMI